MVDPMPYFLIGAGLVVAIQPKTKRWNRRLSAHFSGNEKRMKQRANTFYLLGVSCVVVGCFLLLRK
ncbi:hypothetical protein O0555_23600 [Brevibacillus laterosporus]|uniref:hypothetical protein n=1 Tax=Brevibacillus laterosporus TaxID=1465 RepID=UPI0018CF3177|nr:hypothetical protein [Brevibacillus laterosporus]MBG9796581.1 membrane protein [Brevibacillus laterosporus]MCR8940265.1 hypothetical protein [Brevibacillus laterosporus]MCZ0842904.1 hypothetical protein [Brevibacillus laterosporus]MCZ0846876.1 hypothetical protein [Brevibacillus laterosporus]MED1912550.1 hypothetical protein [Brevibacillus laterosporus]